MKGERGRERERAHTYGREREGGEREEGRERLFVIGRAAVSHKAAVIVTWWVQQSKLDGWYGS